VRFGPDDKFWVTTDPTPNSEMGDILFQASLRDLELQFKGGLTMAQHPTLFTEKAEAKVEAYGRIVAMRASQAIAQRAAEGKPLEGAHRLEILDGNGKVLFETELK